MAATRAKHRPRRRTRFVGMCMVGHTDIIYGADAELRSTCDIYLRDDGGRGHIIGTCKEHIYWEREEYWQ